MLHLTLSAQSTTVNFNFDRNGNRIMRQLVFQEVRGECNIELETFPTYNVGNILDTLEIRLFPNPTYGLFCVEVMGELYGAIIKAVLFSPSGIVLSNRMVDGMRIDYDISHEASGVYLLELSVEEKTRVWKIIKY